MKKKESPGDDPRLWANECRLFSCDESSDSSINVRRGVSYHTKDTPTDVINVPAARQISRHNKWIAYGKSRRRCNRALNLSAMCQALMGWLGAPLEVFAVKKEIIKCFPLN